MQSEPSRVFEKLDPPPGGASGLRRKLASEPRRRGRRIGAAVLGGISIVGGLSLLLYQQDRQAGRAQTRVAVFDVSSIPLGLEDAPSEPATVPPDMRHRQAMLRVPLGTDQVVFYYVAMLPESSSSASSTDAKPSDPSGGPDQGRGAPLDEGVSAEEPDAP